MSDEHNESERVLLQLRAEIANHVKAAGEAVTKYRSVANSITRSAFGRGGVDASFDVGMFLGESALNDQLSALLNWAGFRSLLKNQTIGAMDPDTFVRTLERRVNAGQLRGRARVPAAPNAPPWPGAIVKKTPDLGGTAEPTRFR